MLYVTLRLTLEAIQPTVVKAAELLSEAAVQVAAGKLHGQLPNREFDDRVWFSVEHATEDRPDPHRYVVRLKGRDCAAFVYVRDAYAFVRSEAARDWIAVEADEQNIARRRESGQDVRERDGKVYVPLYEEQDYTIHDRTKSDHRVVGMTSHHGAILEAVNRA